MKKGTAMLLAAAMVLPLVPSAFAENTDTQAQTLLEQIKPRIGATDQYTNFSSNSHTQFGHSVYSFFWSDDDGGEHMEIRCNDLGIITSYYHYDEDKSAYSKENYRIPDMDKAQAEQKAQEFFYKLNPQLDGEMSFTANMPSSLNGGYYVELKHSYDGIEVHNTGGAVRFNNDNSAIESMDFNYQYVTPVSDKAALISADAAKAAFKEKLGMELVYRSRMEKEGVKVYYPAYIVKHDGKYIDALTGEARELEYPEYGYAGGRGESLQNAMKDEATSDSGLTEVEIAEMGKIAGLISSADAEKLARDNKYFEIGGLKLNSISLSRDYANKEKYLYSLHFSDEDFTQNRTVVLDAATGAVKEFYRRGIEDKQTDEDKELSKAVATELAGDKIGEYVYNAEREQFERYVNGVRVEDNCIRACVKNGVLYSYSINYSEGVTFPDVSAIKLDANAAADRLFELSGYAPKYTAEKDGKTGCVYMLGYYSPIDPFTGEELDYNGKPVIDNSMQYTDLDGHWAKPVIETLAVYGIGFEGTEFKPDEDITAKDFNALLDTVLRYSRNADKSDDTGLTRIQAAAQFIDRLGVSEYAAYDIYRQPFTDVTENMGAVAILSAMGVIHGNDNGLFMPNEPISRAEAAVMVYNYLNRK